MENFSSYDWEEIPSRDLKATQPTDVTEDFSRYFVFDVALAKQKNENWEAEEKEKFAQLCEDKH